MAGPWFTVRESGTDWVHVDTIWISDGEGHERARVELQVQLEEPGASREDGAARRST